MDLKQLVNPNRPLTQAETSHIEKLQQEIEDIWTTKGNYQIDDDAWKQMPLFMEEVTEADVNTNPACEALSAMVYDEVPPDDVAANRKEQGNKLLQLALHEAEEKNRVNLARSAFRSYTEGLERVTDRTLKSLLLANRCQAQILIQNYGHALADAQASILLNPKYHKAYYRASVCYLRMSKPSLTIRMAERGIEILKQNSEQTLSKDGPLNEFSQLLVEARKLQQQLTEKAKMESTKLRGSASEAVALAQSLSDLGVRVGRAPEVSSSQMSQYGIQLPFFSSPLDSAEQTTRFITPILLLYDEFDQSDCIHEVSVQEQSFRDILADIVPLPWDTQGRYQTVDDLVIVFVDDDGVQMPQRKVVESINKPIWEVLTRADYAMPGFLPTFHIISKFSDVILQRWGLRSPLQSK